ERRLPDRVVGGADEHRRPARVRGRREREERQYEEDDPAHSDFHDSQGPGACLGIQTKSAQPPRLGWTGVNDRLEESLKKLPAKPGVYLFRGPDDDVLYVGKAKSLRPRVRSYFQRGGDGRLGMDQLVARVADVEVIVTGSEVEALHLEQNLVKRHRPPFNVRLRDDKSFPYIAVTVEDEYPRV